MTELARNNKFDRINKSRFLQVWFNKCKALTSSCDPGLKYVNLYIELNDSAVK